MNPKDVIHRFEIRNDVQLWQCIEEIPNGLRWRCVVADVSLLLVAPTETRRQEHDLETRVEPGATIPSIGTTASRNERIRALAKAEARSNHFHAVIIESEPSGHEFADDELTDYGFNTCSHPDCVLVRGAAETRQPPAEEIK